MRTIRKYIILLFTGILGIITFLCSDFLDTTSGSQLTDNEIYQNEGDIYRAILNIYAQISEEKLYGRTIPLIYSFNTDIEFGTCNATTDNTRPVSYTHLDVYKRQDGYSCATAILE